MKNLLIAAVLLAATSLAALAQGPTRITESIAGWQCGKIPSEPVAFHGAAPVPQASGSAQLALSDSSGGVIPASVSITGTVAAPAVSAAVLVSTGTATPLPLIGVIPGDVVLSAVYQSGTSVLSGTSILEAVISGTDSVLQTGTTINPGTAMVVTVGRKWVGQCFPLLPIVDGTSNANTASNFATLAQAYNALRKALVEKGLIKGQP